MRLVVFDCSEVRWVSFPAGAIRGTVEGTGCSFLARLARVLLSGLLLTSALLGAPGAARAQAGGWARSPETNFVIEGVRVFDGQQVREDVTVVVRDGRIVAVGPGVRPPSGLPVVDGAGRTLLPALLDAHSHTFSPAQLEAALVFGVGTQLDMATSPQLAARWRAEQMEGRAERRADIFSAGLVVTAPGGHGTQFGIPVPGLASAGEAQAYVDARIGEGSDWIKIILDDGSAYGVPFPTIDEATLRAAISAAHARGKLAVVHVARLRDARRAVEAGADGLVHVWSDSVPDEALVAEMRRRGTFVVATLTVIESATGTASGAPLLADARLAPYLGPEARASLGLAFPTRPGMLTNYAAARASVARLQAAGVPILAGTDAPNPGTAHGVSLHRELELLVQAGLSPVEALRAATSVVAAAFRLEGRGRVVPGVPADLVLVAGNPAADITATRSIERVWKAGRAVDREAFRRRVAEALAAVETRTTVPQAVASGHALVSSFDDGSLATVFGTRWMETTDRMVGGSSAVQLEVVDGGAAGTARALRIRGEVRTDAPFPWAGAMFMISTPPAPADVSGAGGLAFYAKGDGRTYQVYVFSRRGGTIPAVASFPAGPEWSEHHFPWSAFNGSDGSDIVGIAITAGPPAGTFELLIDQVQMRPAAR